MEEKNAISTEPKIVKMLVIAIDEQGRTKFDSLGIENDLELIGLFEIMNQKKTEVLMQILKYHESSPLEKKVEVLLDCLEKYSQSK